MLAAIVQDWSGMYPTSFEFASKPRGMLPRAFCHSPSGYVKSGAFSLVCPEILPVPSMEGAESSPRHVRKNAKIISAKEGGCLACGCFALPDPDSHLSRAQRRLIAPRRLWHAFASIAREEGPLALYKGWLPSVIGVVRTSSFWLLSYSSTITFCLRASDFSSMIDSHINRCVAMRIATN